MGVGVVLHYVRCTMYLIAASQGRRPKLAQILELAHAVGISPGPSKGEPTSCACCFGRSEALGGSSSLRCHLPAPPLFQPSRLPEAPQLSPGRGTLE